MRIKAFKNITGENIPSMEVYADELLRNMPTTVEEFTIPAIKFPIIKQYFHKEFIYPRIAGRYQGDINHILDHSYAGLLRYLDPRKTVITCHDLIPLYRPIETSILGKKRFEFNIKYLPKAAKIITASEYTKKCVMRRSGYKEDNIYIIHYGVSDKFRILKNKESLKKKYNIGTQTILHVGSSFPRKNIEFILNLLKKMQDFTLIKIGSFSKQQQRRINSDFGEKRIRIFPFLNPDSLVELYNISDILLIPSVAEGFCMPILEAMACGCPVVCSDIEVFHELYEGAVIFIDPHDVNTAVDKINMLSCNSFLRTDLINKALVRSREFSWQKCAEKTYKVYEIIFAEIDCTI